MWLVYVAQKIKGMGRAGADKQGLLQMAVPDLPRLKFDESIELGVLTQTQTIGVLCVYVGVCACL